MLKVSEYFAVALASTIKFVGGPLAGVAIGLSWWETAFCSSLGMMVTVCIVMYGGEFGKKIMTYFKSKKPKKVFTRINRFAVKVKSKLGLWGIAFLTPLIFTPIVGSLLSLSFKYPKGETFMKMFVCALLWGAIQTVFFDFVRGWF